MVFCVLLSMASSFRLGAYFNNLLEIKKWPNERESILLDRFMRSEPQEVNFIKFGYFFTNNSHLQFYVKDTGIGIKPENISSLFSDFTTLGTNNEEGSGLGLRICRDFVEMHNGKIWCESEIGKGSKFIFQIPKFA